MTTHRISFKDLPNCPIYADIVSGKKKVEGRKNSPKYHNIVEGDTLILADVKGELHCRVTYLHKYSGVREYLEAETIERALPCVKTKSIDAGIEFYEKFVPTEEIESLRKEYGYGFLGIGIELIKEVPTLKVGEIFQTTLKEPHFTDIVNGSKTVEGRLNKGMFGRMKIGDIIIFKSSSTGKKVRVQVTRKTYYDSFKNMIEVEGLSRILPHEKSIDDGVRLYHRYYTPIQEKQYGIVALELRVVKDSENSGQNQIGHSKRQKKSRRNRSKRNRSRTHKGGSGQNMAYIVNKSDYLQLKLSLKS